MARKVNPRRARAPAPRRGLVGRLRNYILTGVIVTAPLGITLYLAVLFIEFVDTRVRALIPERYDPGAFLPDVPGLGLIALVLLLLAVGFLTANLVGRFAVGLGERFIARLPVIRSVYGALKQIFETVFSDSSTSFREVVLVEYPRRGIWAVGFITGTTKGEVQGVTKDRVVNVFLPTTPNPTSGFLLFLPRGDVIPLGMSVEEGIKMVISAGIVTPEMAASAKARASSRARAGGRSPRAKPAARKSATAGKPAAGAKRRAPARRPRSRPPSAGR